jgi:hypothetical protein
MQYLKRLVSIASYAFVAALFTQCASKGPQRQRSFFQAVELAKTADKELAREAFEVACAQSSSAACHRLGQRVPGLSGVPILQGATTETATEIVVLLGDKQAAQFFFWDGNQQTLLEPRKQESTEIPGGLGRLVSLQYDGLEVGTPYQLQVVGAAGELLDGRTVKALELSKKRAKVAVASLLDTPHALKESMWRDLVAFEPDAIFLVGNQLANEVVPPSPPVLSTEALWKQYAENRREVGLFRLEALVPIFATWGDRDFGQREGDRSHGLKEDAKGIFRSFFGKVDYPGVYDRGPGVSSRLLAFGQRFFFLDPYSLRSPSAEKRNQTHFGVDQEAWLFTDLFGDTPNWLISGDPFFLAEPRWASYEGKQPESFRRFIRRLKSQSSPLIFLSGLREGAQLFEIPPEILGYRTYEISAGSIHGAIPSSSGETAPNARRLEAALKENSFLVIQMDTNNGWSLDVRAVGIDRKRLFSRALEIKKALP